MVENAPNNKLGDNLVILGEEAGGNITFAVHGREGRSILNVKEITCIGYCSNNVVIDEEEEEGTYYRYWSNPDDWDNLPGRIPIEGDEIEIL